MVKFTTHKFSLLILIVLLVSIVPAFAQDETGVVAYTTTADGTSRMMLLDANGNSVPISDGQGNDFYPTLSPDGNQVAFVSDRSGNLELYVANSDGSNATALTSNDYNDVSPSWSSDGTQIVFASDRDGDLDIYVTDLSGNVQQVTNDDANDWAPSWSPLEDLIAFTSDRDVDSEIYVTDLGGNNIHNLTNYPRGDDAYPSWSPDGEFIAFSSNRSRGGSLQVYTIPVFGGDAVQITSGSEDSSYPTWNSDGSLLAYMTGSEGSTALAVISTSGGDAQFLTNADGSGYPSWWWSLRQQ
jgi:Tol biopolymer transport system component